MLSAYVLQRTPLLVYSFPGLAISGVTARRVERLRHYIDQCGNSELSQLTADLSLSLSLSNPLSLVEYSSELCVYVWKH